jgi:Protein of unknown function (DUF3455)
MRLLVPTLVVALTMATPLAADTFQITLPSTPAAIQAPADQRPYLMVHAIGTQAYMCVATTTGVAWMFTGPQATIFKDDLSQVLTHFLSPNPVEGGTLRATWQHSRDTSAVWARAIQTSTDPAYVAPGSIPWLLLQVVGTQDGPTGGDRMTATTYIQRIGTLGGLAPSTGCAVPTDVNARAFVPYEADYVFYRQHGERP